MPTQTPLTDQLNALTAYINTVTSGSDTCLSDAVETLADGYGQGGGGNVITIAEGTVAGTGTYDVEIDLGSKAPLRDFYILLYAQNGQEFTYNTARNIAVMQYAIHSEISEMQFKQHVGGYNYDLYNPVGINQYTTNNDGTIITNTYKGDASKEVNLYQATATAQEELVYQVEFRKYTATGQWAMHLNRSNGAFVLPTYVTYKYKLVYFGNDPANDIDGWDGIGGGRYSADQIASGDITDDIVITGTTLRAYAFAGTKITSISAPNVDTIGTFWSGGANVKDAVFTGCRQLVSASFPKLTELTGSFFGYCDKLTSVYLPKVQTVATNSFANCNSLPVLVLPSYVGLTSGVMWNMGKMLGLLALDINGVTSIIAKNFQNSAKLATLILRNSTMATLANINAFAGTPFANGGTGGTLYVPSALIVDYQLANNWNTILSYANNRILTIEGSIYETQYADGTPIV